MELANRGISMKEMKHVFGIIANRNRKWAPASTRGKNSRVIPIRPRSALEVPDHGAVDRRNQLVARETE